MIPPNFLGQEDKAVEFLSGLFQMLGPAGVLVGGFAAASLSVSPLYGSQLFSIVLALSTRKICEEPDSHLALMTSAELACSASGASSATGRCIFPSGAHLIYASTGPSWELAPDQPCRD